MAQGFRATGLGWFGGLGFQHSQLGHDWQGSWFRVVLHKGSETSSPSSTCMPDADLHSPHVDLQHPGQVVRQHGMYVYIHIRDLA